jgi:hypothetical protein
MDTIDKFKEVEKTWMQTQAWGMRRAQKVLSWVFIILGTTIFIYNVIIGDLSTAFFGLMVMGGLGLLYRWVYIKNSRFLQQTGAADKKPSELLKNYGQAWKNVIKK